MAEAPRSNRIIRFGVFEADLGAGVLRKQGVRIRLQEQPFRILAALLERPGEIVAREELIGRLWPNGTVVEYEHSLGTAVNKIRQALGDTADNPRFVETVPRRGYRFLLPVETLPRPSESPAESPSWQAAGLPSENGVISHYRILEKLGEGGMGVVYKAEDTKLERPVALKFLAPQAIEDPEHKARFVREAKAAARLDHPNICSIHEIDESGGRLFLAMAYLEGQTVKDKIAERPLPLEKALDIAIQAAEGLQAAHEKGIVHRDIKSANLMLSPRGRVKIMDFGLAQLADGTRLTKGPAMMGTPAYMSPEQAQRQPADRRTDIWSLGVVLYEMVTGRVPFASDRETATLHAIIHEDPEPVTALRTGVPIELDAIVAKALAKDPQQRYQHADDLLVDLRNLRKELEAAQLRKRASGAVPSPDVGRKRKLAAAVLVAAGLGWWFGRSSESTVEGPPQYRLTEITRDTGYTRDPALSPDGRLLAYSSDRSGGGNLDIWVQQLGGGEPIRLTTHEAEDAGPSFSPDGNRIVFRSGRDGSGIYIVPALGGTPRRIADGGAHSIPRFSPDGASVSYTQFYQGFQRAWVVPTSGGAPRQIETNLATVRPDAWSPDGRYLLALGFIGAVTRERGDMWLVPVEGGDAVALGVRELYAVAGLQVGRGGMFPHPRAWSADGDWVVFDARTQGATRNLWRVRISASEKRLVGNLRS